MEDGPKRSGETSMRAEPGVEGLKRRYRRMRIRRRFAVLSAMGAVVAVTAAGVAIAAPTSTFTFKASPSTAPKKTFQAGSLFTNLTTHYTNPGNNNPGGAVERTQIFLDKNFKVTPSAAAKCSASKLSGKTMKQAMAACSKAKVGSGTATASANGVFTIHGCVLLFNGKPTPTGLPTLQVFTRVNASPPGNISCSDPAHNSQGNATVLLNGVYRPASGQYSKILDVNHITQSAAFPLEVFKTTVKKGNYASARCAAADHLWHMKVTWTYNNDTKKTVSKTQTCTVG
jgi:hypothetical protein